MSGILIMRRSLPKCWCSRSSHGLDHLGGGSDCSCSGPRAASIDGGARALRKSRLSRGHDGKAALLAGSLLKRRIRMRWRIHSAVCVLFFAAGCLPREFGPRRRQPGVQDGAGTRFGISLALRSGLPQAREKFDNWESQHPEELSAKWPLQPAISSRNFSVRACSPAISSE